MFVIDLAKNNNLLLLLIINFIFTYISLKIYIKSNCLKEVVRDELQHKMNQNNIAVGGGVVFISTFMIFSLIYFKCFNLNMIIIGNYFLWKKPIVSNKKIEKLMNILHISSIILYICSFSSTLFNVIYNEQLLYYINHYLHSKLFVIFTSISLTMIFGFYDDIQKIYYKTGLKARVIFIFSHCIGIFVVLHNYLQNKTWISLLSYKLDLNFFYIPFGLFIFSSLINSCNLTDGINGGLSIPFLIIQLFFIFISHYYIFDFDLFVLSSMFISSIIPFIYLNLKNQIFMGNVGSMAIGSYLASISLIYKLEMLIPLYCLLFLLETLSCLLQIFWVKMFKKRLFLFTPFHHHFELLKWPNYKIIILMSSITLLGISISFFVI